MPHFERPNSFGEHSSDQYTIHRLEHDLYELFEEQQILLDIVAQQQERVEHQKLIEPAAGMATSQLELLPTPLQMEDTHDEPAAEPKPKPVHLQPQPATILTTVEEEQPQSDATSILSMPDSFCSQILRQSHHYMMPGIPGISVIPSISGTKCSTPKLTGLGYDAPFPYPKRMSKSRGRRAQYIFKIVDNLMLELQRFLNLTPTGCLPLPLAMRVPQGGSSVTITELENEPKISTGALPKLKYKSFVTSSIHRSAKLKSTKRLNEQQKKPSLLEQEIDLDCEFGMDHIEKFRADRVREYHYMLMNTIQFPDQDQKDMKTSLDNEHCCPVLEEVPAIQKNNGLLSSMPSSSTQPMTICSTGATSGCTSPIWHNLSHSPTSSTHRQYIKPGRSSGGKALLQLAFTNNPEANGLQVNQERHKGNDKEFNAAIEDQLWKCFEQVVWSPDQFSAQPPTSQPSTPMSKWTFKGFNAYDAFKNDEQ